MTYFSHNERRELGTRQGEMVESALGVFTRFPMCSGGLTPELFLQPQGNGHEARAFFVLLFCGARRRRALIYIGCNNSTTKVYARRHALRHNLEGNFEKEKQCFYLC